MKERPILFSAPMVAAILENHKFQTRRVVKPQPEVSEQGNLCGEWLRRPLNGLILPKLQDIKIHCPYGQFGDHLWVRETFDLGSDMAGKPILATEPGMGKLLAMHPEVPEGSDRWCLEWKKKPSIFMPRWASRITLEISGVRIERLQDISQEDAYAEGCSDRDRPDLPYISGFGGARIVNTYAALWESINGEKYPWMQNPFVWVISFRRIKP